jgi:hypothetical protein
MDKRRHLDILMFPDCSQHYLTLNGFQSNIDFSGDKLHIKAVSCRTRKQDKISSDGAVTRRVKLFIKKNEHLLIMDMNTTSTKQIN